MSEVVKCSSSKKIRLHVKNGYNCDLVLGNSDLVGLIFSHFYIKQILSILRACCRHSHEILPINKLCKEKWT